MKITLRANPKCALCLGSGRSTPFSTLCGRPVCHCVTEQLEIIVVEPDYKIPSLDRYHPGAPEFVKEEAV